MEKINFENLPSTNTPINGSNLNQLQDNIEAALLNIYTINTNINFEDTYQNDLLKNAKFVAVNWNHDSWCMQTFHMSDSYSLNTYSENSVGSVYNSNAGTIKYQYSTDNDHFVIDKILVIK